MVEQAGGCAMQAILSVVPVAEAIGVQQRPVSGVPDAAVLVLDVEIYRDLADVVE